MFADPQLLPTGTVLPFFTCVLIRKIHRCGNLRNDGTVSSPPSTTIGPAMPAKICPSTNMWTMRVVPVGARRIVAREVVRVGEALAGVDPQEHVVAVPRRRDVKSVRVQVRGLRQVVDQVDHELVPVAQHQRRPGEAPVVVHRDDAMVVDPDRADRGAQRRVEDAVAAVTQRRLGEAVVDQRRDILVARRATGRALGTRPRRAPGRAHDCPRNDTSQCRNQHDADQPTIWSVPSSFSSNDREHHIHHRHVRVERPVHLDAYGGAGRLTPRADECGPSRGRAHGSHNTEFFAPEGDDLRSQRPAASGADRSAARSAVSARSDRPATGLSLCSHCGTLSP